MQRKAFKVIPSAHDQLVDATIESIYRYGLSDTSVATVTEIAGLSRGMVRHCFSSKDAMLIAVYESLISEWRQSFFSVKGETSFETVVLMAGAMFGPTNLEPKKATAWMTFVVACLHDKELNRICRKEYESWRETISGELRAHREQTGLDFDVEGVVDTMLATADGLWLRSRIEPERITPERGRDVMVRLVQELVPTK